MKIEDLQIDETYVLHEYRNFKQVYVGLKLVRISFNLTNTKFSHKTLYTFALEENNKYGEFYYPLYAFEIQASLKKNHFKKAPRLWKLLYEL